MWSFVDFDFCLVPDTKISTWFKVMKLKPDWRTFHRKLMIESAIYPPNILDLLLYQWIMYNALYDVLMFCLFFLLKPLTPRSDWHVTSPYNIHTLLSKQVMRILKLRQVEVIILIYHQILVTNLQGNESKLEGRINN